MTVRVAHDRHRHKDLLGNGLDHLQQFLATAGLLEIRDENQAVRTVFLVLKGQLDRVANVQ